MNERAYFYKGLTFLQKKEFIKALAEFTQALKIAPKSDDSLYYRSICYKLLENHDKALEDIKTALTFNKDFPLYLLTKGLILY
jgi:tetratricopeptide (TPR) repeat protein